MKAICEKRPETDYVRWLKAQVKKGAHKEPERDPFAEPPRKPKAQSPTPAPAPVVIRIRPNPKPIEKPHRISVAHKEKLVRGRVRAFEERGAHLSRSPLGYRIEYLSADGASLPRGKDRGLRPALKIVEKEAEIVRQIFALYLSLGAIQRVVDWAKEHEPGYRWSRAKVHHILRNDTYRGFVRLNDRVRKGTHEPLVSESVFREAGERLVLAQRGWAARRRRAERAKRSHAHANCCRKGTESACR